MEIEWRRGGRGRISAESDARSRRKDKGSWGEGEGNVEEKIVSRCVKSLSMRILKNFARVLLG